MLYSMVIAGIFWVTSHRFKGFYKTKKAIVKIVPPEIVPGKAMISITFDDGRKSDFTIAAPLMNRFGFAGTSFIYPQAQDKQWAEFMHWEQVQRLQDKYQWEIGSHTYSHVKLTELSVVQIEQELHKSKSALLQHEINVQSFASPFGEYNNNIVTLIRRPYLSHRTAWPDAANNWDDLNPYELKCVMILGDTPVKEIEHWIDNAIENKQWLILLFHKLTQNRLTPKNEYSYFSRDFEHILMYISEQKIPVVRIVDVIVTAP